MPTLSTATVNGTTLTLTYDENLDETSTSAISVTLDYTAPAISYISIDSSARTDDTYAIGDEIEMLLAFAYTVAAGDADTDGISVAANKLTLPGGAAIMGTAARHRTARRSALVGGQAAMFNRRRRRLFN